MANTAEALRIAGLLESLIAFKKRPIRQLEDDLGFGYGTLARLFSGKIELKYRHILDILEALKVSPLAFFELAYAGQDEDEKGLTEQLGKVVGMKAMPPPVPTPEIDPAMIETMVLEALKKFELLDPGEGEEPEEDEEEEPGEPKPEPSE